MTENRINDGQYEKPSCSILSMIEASMIAASPDPPTPTPSTPTPINPPTSGTTDVTNPNYAKQFKNFDPWREWDD